MSSYGSAVGTDPTRAGGSPARVAATAYFVLAAIGLVGTWYYNIVFFGSGAGQDYLGAWFANPASSSAAVDVIVTAVVACVFYVREGTRLGWGRLRLAAMVVLTFAVALAFTLPAFLALRELHLARSKAQ